MADMNNTINFPSTRHLQKWGGSNLGRLAAPQPYLSLQETSQTQRTISLSHPLYSRPDEIVSPPSVWQRAAPNTRILAFLGGAGHESPRLRPTDRTVHQPSQDLHRGTSYVTDYCRPATLRTSALPALPKRLPASESRAAAIGWVNDESTLPRDVHRASRFGLRLPASRGEASLSLSNQSAALDMPYNPSKHGVRSTIKAKDWLGPNPDMDF